MTNSNDLSATQVAVVNAFHRRFIADRERGVVREIEDYVSLFRSHAELIREEYELITTPRRRTAREEGQASAMAD